MFFRGLALLWLVGLIGANVVAAQETEPKAAPKAAVAPEKDSGGTVTGRLPPYFAAIVTAAQRKEIYQLQSRYANQMEALQKQLDAIASERDKAVDAVLTAEQLTAVNKKRDEAKARAQSRRKPAPATTAAETSASEESQ